MPASEDLIPRSISAAVRTALADTPVVCLLGARQCGKTTLARQLEPNRAFYSLDDPGHFATARTDPAGFVQSLPDTVTLDEIQRVPELLPVIKLAVDEDRRPGRFLLTGSANLLLLPRVTESLAGRIEMVRLHPFTEAEKERRPGRFVQTLLDNAFRPEIRPSLPRPGLAPPRPDIALAERLVAGGYPETRDRAPERVRLWHRQYLAAIIERGLKDAARVHHADRLLQLLAALAARTAQLLNVSSLAKHLELQRPTVLHYLSVLERLFLVRRLRAWPRNPGKKAVTTPKVHLIDSGLAASLSGLRASDRVDNRGPMGPLLESFVVQQLAAQAAWTDPDLKLRHYRDHQKVEVDAVLTRGRDVWGVEIKAAASADPRDGRGLRQLAEACGQNFRGGALLYTGDSTLPLGDKRMLAVPMRELWER